MTVQEEFKKEFNLLKKEINEFSKDTIQIAEELEKYRALGTVEELKHLKEMNKDCTIEQLTGVECSYNETGCSDCKGKQALLEAMKKQIPKKPNLEQKDSMGNPIERCPNCLSFGVVYYCANCGQKIDWEEGGTSD